MLQTSLQALAEDAFIIDDNGEHWDADVGLLNGGVIPASAAQLFRVYFGALGRLPDNDGFRWWSNEIAEGKHDLRSMAAGFVFSEEFQRIADADDDGVVSNAEFVDHMYRNVFGREPDPPGYEWWTSGLSAGRTSQSDVLVDMTQSNEYVALTIADVAGYLPLGGTTPVDEEATDNPETLQLSEIAERMSPIIEVAPIYPRRAQTRGIEGFCLLSFTVTTSGSVADVTTVNCEPVGVFDRVSIDALAKFKYKPLVIDGTPVEVPGVVHRFDFRLGGRLRAR